MHASVLSATLDGMALNIGMVTIDCADPRRLTEFWTEALDMTVVADYGEFVLLGSRNGNGVNLGLQRVPEQRTGKNSVHIDLRGGDRTTEVRRLTESGASIVDEHTVPGFAWTVLADPEGNQFCVSESVS